MPAISIECPDDVLQALQETPERFAEEARVLLAAKLYEVGRLSSGRAAQLAGVGRVAFLDALKSYQVPVVNLTSGDLRKDFEVARDLQR